MYSIKHRLQIKKRVWEFVSSENGVLQRFCKSTSSYTLLITPFFIFNSYNSITILPDSLHIVVCLKSPS